jgi:8-hydroxy-5-deazaflavin:NADPH oxidoreductase
MVTPVQIGILGATGPAGSGLAARLASVGYDVVVGSRQVERAVEVRDTIIERWPDHTLAIEAADNAGAADADLIVIATPWDGAAVTAGSVAEHVRGKVVISMANALTKVGTEFEPLIPPRGSVAAHVQAAIPRSFVAAALHHVPAKELGNLDHPCEIDILVCSDHPAATAATIELIDAMPGMRPLDAGELSNAAAIEAFTAVLLQLNVRYKTRAAVQFTGIEL